MPIKQPLKVVVLILGRSSAWLFVALLTLCCVIHAVWNAVIAVCCDVGWGSVTGVNSAAVAECLDFELTA